MSNAIWRRTFILMFINLCNLVSSGIGSPLSEKFKITIRMPDAISEKPDALLCHAVKLPEEESYILKYEPHATKDVAHHMMVYGCGTPGSDDPYWSCGEMDDRSNSSVCADGERDIVYAWAFDAPAKEFPEGVGFRVSGSTRTKYLIIQLHYKDAFQSDQTDNSGITLHMTRKRQPKQAGFYVLGSYGTIPPNARNYHVETSCQYRGPDIYAIAFRTHSHNLGRVTSGYRVRGGNWTEIGRMSPQLPQAFYNVTNGVVNIQDGDILAARCTMSSFRHTSTAFGPTNRDEMCNFYILYYTEWQEDLRIRYCLRDANRFRWRDYLSNIPDKEASSSAGLPAFVFNDPYATNSQL